MARIVRRSRSSLVVTPQRRAMRWLGSTLRTDEQGLGAGTVVLDQSFAQAQIAVIGDFTITRVRGLLSVASDQFIATEQAFGAMGFMVVSEQARAAGVASIPDPYDEAFDSGWFVHQYWRAPMAVTVGAPASFAGAERWSHYVIDAKAQRKVQSSDAIAIILRNTSAVDGATFQLDFRMLIKTN